MTGKRYIGVRGTYYHTMVTLGVRDVNCIHFGYWYSNFTLQLLRHLDRQFTCSFQGLIWTWYQKKQNHPWLVLNPSCPAYNQALPEMSISTYAKLITPYQGFLAFFLWQHTLVLILQYTKSYASVHECRHIICSYYSSYRCACHLYIYFLWYTLQFMQIIRLGTF